VTVFRRDDSRSSHEPEESMLEVIASIMIVLVFLVAAIGIAGGVIYWFVGG